MSKFCGKCGSRLDENTDLCPNCDKQSINYNDNFDDASKGKSDDVAEHYKYAYGEENIHSKKDTGRNILISVLATACVALIVTTVIFFYPLFSEDSKSENEKTIPVDYETTSALENISTAKTKNDVETSSIKEDGKSDKASSAQASVNSAQNSNYDSDKKSEASHISVDENNNSKNNCSEIESNNSVNDYSQYVGKWEKNYPESNGAGLWVDIIDVNGNQITFTMCKTAPNFAHIAMTESITAEINYDNEVRFSFEDSFCNEGTGYIKLSEDSIYLKTDFIEFYQPYIYALIADDTLTKSTD